MIRLPRHGASCPIGMGVSCSADRNIKAKINRDGIWIEKLESNRENISLNICVRPAKAGGSINLNQPMSEITAAVGTSGLHPPELNGTIIVARDIAHAKLKELIDNGERCRSTSKITDLHAGPAKRQPVTLPAPSAQPLPAAWTLTLICCSPTARAW